MKTMSFARAAYRITIRRLAKSYALTRLRDILPGPPAALVFFRQKRRRLGTCHIWFAHCAERHVMQKSSVTVTVCVKLRVLAVTVILNSYYCNVSVGR